MAEEKTGGKTGGKTAGKAGPTARARTALGQAVWLLAVLCALCLAIGALLIALDANRHNGLVKFILDLADGVDLGVFSRDNGIFKLHGGDAATKNALANWGLGAVVYLVVGRIVDRIVRP